MRTEFEDAGVTFHPELGRWAIEIDGAIFWIEVRTVFGYTVGDAPSDFWEMTAPANQGFLDRINDAFGTSFNMNDFDGR
jgi:hypothetical protein